MSLVPNFISIEKGVIEGTIEDKAMTLVAISVFYFDHSNFSFSSCRNLA
jgi:hypothetical protein